MTWIAVAIIVAAIVVLVATVIFVRQLSETTQELSRTNDAATTISGVIDAIAG